jgi:hypothetical protein
MPETLRLPTPSAKTIASENSDAFSRTSNQIITSARRRFPKKTFNRPRHVLSPSHVDQRVKISFTPEGVEHISGEITGDKPLVKVSLTPKGVEHKIISTCVGFIKTEKVSLTLELFIDFTLEWTERLSNSQSLLNYRLT